MTFITLSEVGPRDGLQSIKAIMPLEAKQRWIAAEAACGVREIEVGSFVPPTLLPQMADTPELVQFARGIAGLNVVADLGIHDGYSRPLDIWGELERRLAGLPLLRVGVACPVEIIMARRNADPQGGHYVGGDGVPAPVARMQAAIPEMVKVKGASIINISSVEGLRGSAGLHAYVATKFAVRGLTKSVALDVARFGIRVNSIHPGLIETDMTKNIKASALQIPMGRSAQPAEVAKLMLFLASDESSYSTGAEFVIDGGLTAGVPHN